MIKQKELEDLCTLIDFYYKHYIEKLSQLSRIYGVENFEMSKRYRGVFRLFKTTRQIWCELLEFARKYDFDNDCTEWNIFDSGTNTIKIVSRHDDKRFDSAFHSYILPEPEEHEFLPNLRYPDNDLWICWQAMKINGGEKYSYRNIWTAEETYKFLTEKMIPKIIYESENQHKLIRQNFKKFLSKFDINRYISGQHPTLPFSPTRFTRG